MLPRGAPPGPATVYAKMPPELSPMSPFLTAATAPMPETVKSREFIEMNLYYMRLLNEGMAGMTHAKDIRTAEGLLDAPLPPDMVGAMTSFREMLNDAVVADHRKQGVDIGDPYDAHRQHYATEM